MTDKMNEESIESIVAERLDKIFGDDSDDDFLLSEAQEEASSPLEDLKGAVEALCAVQSKENAGRMGSEISKLQDTLGKDPLYRPLLKMSGILAKYVWTARDRLDPETTEKVRSIFECMERIEGEGDLSIDAKRGLVQSEIDSFKAFRDRIKDKKAVSHEKAAVKKPAMEESERVELAPESPQQTTPPPAAPPEPEEISPDVEIYARAEPVEIDQITIVEEPPLVDEVEVVEEGEDEDETLVQDAFVDLSVEEDVAEDVAEEEAEEEVVVEEYDEEAGVDEGTVPVSPGILFEEPGQEPAHEIPAGAVINEDAFKEFREWVSGELNTLKQGVEEIKASMPPPSRQEDEIRKDLSRIHSGLQELSGLPDSIRGVQVFSQGAINSINSSIDGLRSSMAEQKPLLDMGPFEDLLKKQLEDLKKGLSTTFNISSDLHELGKYISTTVSGLEDELQLIREEFESVKGDIHSIRLDLNQLRAFAEEYESEGSGHQRVETLKPEVPQPAAPEPTPPPEPQIEEPPPLPTEDDSLVADSTFGQWDWDDNGLNWDSNGSFGESIHEETFSPEQDDLNFNEEDNPLPPVVEEEEEEVETEERKESPSPMEGAANTTPLPSGEYFLFEAGGRKYAVDAKYVVKSAKLKAAIAKKAQNNGSLTITDTKKPFANLRKDIEPDWKSISDLEIKKGAFRLIPQNALDGLSSTKGEGALYLGTEGNRLLLLTDSPALKVTLGEGDEVQMSSLSDTSPSAACGSILRSGHGEEFYLIIAPELLVMNLQII